MNYPQIIDSNWNYIKVLFNQTQHEFGSTFTNRADLILGPNHLEEWNWKDKRILCNNHEPGITKQAIDYLINLGCNTIIVSRGYECVLQTQPDVLKYAK